MYKYTLTLLFLALLAGLFYQPVSMEDVEMVVARRSGNTDVNSKAKVLQPIPMPTDTSLTFHPKFSIRSIATSW